MSANDSFDEKDFEMVFLDGQLSLNQLPSTSMRKGFEIEKDLTDLILLENFKKQFYTHPFSYRPIIHGFYNFKISEQFLGKLDDEYSPRSIKTWIGLEKQEITNANWKFSLCEKGGYSPFVPKKPKTIVSTENTYSYNFKKYIFSWNMDNMSENFSSEVSLIPNSLLDAIKRNNFELFFLQKSNSDDRRHTTYLDVLHNLPPSQINIASPISLFDLIFLFSVVIILFSFHSRQSTSGDSKTFE